jgi:hypothetical protein
MTIARLDQDTCKDMPDGEVSSIQHYVIKFASDLRQVDGLLGYTGFPPTIKLDRHDITEILLKVTLNSINQTIYDNITHANFITYCSCRIMYKNNA